MGESPTETITTEGQVQGIAKIQYPDICTGKSRQDYRVFRGIGHAMAPERLLNLL